MKKLLVCFFIAAMLFPLPRCFCEISDVNDLVESLGLAASASEDVSGGCVCDFILLTASDAGLEWSDGHTMYRVEGPLDILSQVYAKALGMFEWDSCRAVVNGRPMVSYGTASAQVHDDLAGFKAHMCATLGIRDAEAEITTEQRSFVINTKSMRFHDPACPGVKTMSEKNRRDYTGSRAALIDSGYTPCGTCNP